jgi:hypothetical protein
MDESLDVRQLIQNEEPYSRVLLDNSERLLLVISCNAMEKVMLNHQH